jgi:hypothetical protein
VKKEDGAFWMSFQDFCINFDEVYVARFFPSSLWPSKGQVHGEWRGVTAGGCLNHETVKNNVQYGLTVLEPGKADICIALLLEDVRGQDGKQAGDFPLVILEVYDHQGRPVTQRDRGQQLASSADNLQEIFIECTVQVDASGSKTYTVIPCCFEPGVETSYTLRWHCSRKAKFQQFDQKADQNAVVETRRR